ncbi:MAG: DNA adenine methylase [Dysgonamonadaceae bacterium]
MYSPLRYPGGKSKLYPFVKLMIRKYKLNNGVYIEPFAGGAGVALSLLINKDVQQIVINDYDKAIYSFWRAITKETNAFISLIEQTPVNTETWKKQKAIYENEGDRYSLELGFAAFYLNRTNRSGILKAGPIGGLNQTGEYKICARYNKENLINRILLIAEHKKNIKVYNKDIISFIRNIIPRFDNCFIYFDPPYFNKGPKLYTNFFTYEDHKRISQEIKKINCPWIVTYDNVDKIIELYDGYICKEFDLTYSVANTGKSSEIMFIHSNKMWPTKKELMKANVKINLRERELEKWHY